MLARHYGAPGCLKCPANFEKHYLKHPGISLHAHASSCTASVSPKALFISGTTSSSSCHKRTFIRSNRRQQCSTCIAVFRTGVLLTLRFGRPTFFLDSSFFSSGGFGLGCASDITCSRGATTKSKKPFC